MVGHVRFDRNALCTSWQNSCHCLSISEDSRINGLRRRVLLRGFPGVSTFMTPCSKANTRRGSHALVPLNLTIDPCLRNSIPNLHCRPGSDTERPRHPAIGTVLWT